MNLESALLLGLDLLSFAFSIWVLVVSRRLSRFLAPTSAHLIFLLALNDLLLSLVYACLPLLGERLFTAHGGLLCTINGAVDIFAITAATLAIFSHHLHSIVRLLRPLRLPREHSSTFSLIALYLLVFVPSLLFAGYAVLQDAIAPSGGWCFLASTQIGLRTLFYLFVFVTFGTCLLFAFTGTVQLRGLRLRQYQRKHLSTLPSAFVAAYHSLFTTIGFLIIWTPIALIRLLEAIRASDEASQSYPTLTKLSLITCNSRGIVDGAVYVGVRQLRQYRFNRLSSSGLSHEMTQRRPSCPSDEFPPSSPRPAKI
jgi:hypothetical protein